MTALIALDQVTKAYGSGEARVEVLHGLSLSIEAGEFVAILGASGSGKSTLMNIIGCLDRPTSGTYRLSGTDVASLGLGELAGLRRDMFGFIFQQYNLLPQATAEENVEIPAIYAGTPRAARTSRARDLLSRLNLTDRLHHRPSQLSGGQQQRVSIARALMNGGKIILADEPTGALDSHSGAEVMALLRELNAEGHTVILITHDPAVAAQAQRQIHISDGAITEDTATGTAPAARTAGEPAPAKAASSFLVRLGEAVHMALRAMRGNTLRTLLTLLGIIIGVGSVIAMQAIGNGAKTAVVSRIEEMGTDLLTVRPGGRNMRGMGSSIATLTVEDAQVIAELPGVLTAVPAISGSVTLRYANSDYQTSATATTADYAEANNWDLTEGMFFLADDVDRSAPVMTIGQTVVEALFPDGGDPIGTYVLVDSIPFQVIGVMEAKGSTGFGGDRDAVVFVPLDTGMNRLFGQRYLNSVTVEVAADVDMDGVQAAIEDLLRSRHGTEDFEVRNTASLLEAVTETQDTFTLLLGSVAAISLLVGGIGVMNIMLVSVTERTREIGIRMATGARPGDIQLQFLSEALVVCATGGILGVGMGLGAAAVIGQLGLPSLVTVPPVALAFCCAVGTGLLFGFLPARKAAHLDPVVALASN
ncbi:MAG: MacB family efflux pump subunit [Rhodospirillaceae bacterium]|nr:MacB family efflux pump subunit [Rhodospirillaceae bacterium]